MQPDQFSFDAYQQAMGWADPMEFPDSIYGGYGLGQPQGALGALGQREGGGVPGWADRRDPKTGHLYSNVTPDVEVRAYESFQDGLESIFGGGDQRNDRDEWEPDDDFRDQMERDIENNPGIF